MLNGQGHFAGYVRMGSHDMSRSMSMGIEDRHEQGCGHEDEHEHEYVDPGHGYPGRKSMSTNMIIGIQITRVSINMSMSLGTQKSYLRNKPQNKYAEHM